MEKIVMYRDIYTGEISSGPKILVSSLGEYQRKMLAANYWNIHCFFEKEAHEN